MRSPPLKTFKSIIIYNTCTCRYDKIQYLNISKKLFFLCPRDEESGGILIYPCPSVHLSGYRYMICPAISSYSFGATTLIFCRMFIHIMEVCMSTGFWWSGGGIICVLQTHFIFKKSLLTKQLCP